MSNIIEPSNWIKYTSDLLECKQVKRLMKDFASGQGLGVFTFLIIKLRKEKGYKYPIDDIDLLSDEIGVSIPVITTIITNYKLFEIDEIHFFCPSLNYWMKSYDKKLIDTSKAGKISAEKRKSEKSKRLSEYGSSQQLLNGRDTEREVEVEREEELTTTTIYSNKDFIEVANLYGISEDDYKDEIQGFIDFNDNEKRRLTVTNWKKWCLKYQEHELKKLKENKRQSK